MEDGPKQVLLVDDDARFLKTLAERIRLMGLEPIKAASGPESLDLARGNALSLAIVDLQMPGVDGLVTIAKLRELQPNLKTVLLTGHGSEKVRQATEALDASYFEKDDMPHFWEFMKDLDSRSRVIIINPPGADPGNGRGRGARAVEYPRKTAAAVDREISPPYELMRLVGGTPAMEALKRKISKVAVVDCPVLIAGEEGVGKELAARTLHRLSPRRNGPFLAVNCGSFSPDLLAGELFGPGDAPSGNGIFESVAGGTILIDGIVDMPGQVQERLLFLLREKAVVRMGSQRPIPLDVRVLAAARKDLAESTEQGGFIRELYEKLDVFELHVPPLRERRDDIAMLCSFFLRGFAAQFSSPARRVSPKVLELFMNYTFSGNVRELENIMERAVILCDGPEILPGHLPERFRAMTPARLPAAPARWESLAEMENRYILQVLEATGGNRSRTAEILGISRAALWRKLKVLKADE